MKRLVWIVIIAVVLVALAIAAVAAMTLPAVSATSRLDAHSRSIDIDICIRCTQPADSRQTIVTLHDDAEGNAAGWNPGLTDVGSWNIQAPIDLVPEMSFEATAVNPATDPRVPTQHRTVECNIFAIDTSTDKFALSCFTGEEPSVVEGATLTYIITE